MSVRVIKNAVVPLCLVVSIAAHCNGQSSGFHDVAPENDVVDALSAGFNEWLSQVRFKGNYELRHGRSKSLAIGLTGDCDVWVSGLDGGPVQARGFIAKKDSALRYSKTFPSAATKVGQDKDSNQWKNVSFDEITYGRLQARVNKGISAGKDVILIEKNAEDGIQYSLQAGDKSRREISPLAIASGPARSPLFMRIPVAATADEIVVASSEPTAVSIEVVMTFERGSRLKKKAVKFRTDVSPPVVTEIRRSSRIGDASPNEAGARASDFVECAGGSVARKVVYCVRANSSEYAEHPWLSLVWYCEDLGAVEPIDKDFRLPVAESNRVVGLKDSSPRSEVALDAIDASELILSREEANELASEVEPSHSFGRSALILVNVLLLLFAGWALWRRQSARRVV